MKSQFEQKIVKCLMYMCVLSVSAFLTVFFFPIHLVLSIVWGGRKGGI